MSEEEALEELKAILDNNDRDWEYIHIKADQLLCSLLEDKYPQLVKEYKALTKWYA